jgi:raffinose/stachyose/melibiose transport system substrate-binding protein
MKPTKFFLFMFMAIAMMLSAACGTAATPTAAQPPAAETQAPAAQQPAGGEKVELVFWSMWNETEPQAMVLTDLMNKFTQENPNITFSAVWNGRENQTKLRTALSGGTVVDFMDQDSDQVAGGMMTEGLGYPLDDFMKENPDVVSLYAPHILDQYVTADGTHFLWPIMSSPVMFWYNKDIFAQAGITTPPTTWDELMSACEKIKGTGVPAITTESNEPEYDNYWFNYLVERQKGKNFLPQVIEDKTGEMWKDPAILNAVQMFQGMWEKGCVPQEAKGFIWPAGQQLLATDKAGAELCGSWLPNELRDTTRPDFNWGGFQFPAVPGGEGDIGDLHVWTGSMMILKDSQHPKEAFEFLKFAMSDESQAAISQAAIQGVPNKNVAWPEALADGATAEQNAHDVILAIGGALAFHPEFAKNVLAPNLTSAFYGNMTAEEFTNKMASDAADYWKTHDK